MTRQQIKNVFHNFLRRCSNLRKTIKRILPLILFFLFAGGSLFFLFSIDQLQYVPSTLLSTLAALFGYYAFQFSHEKFRLDLLDKRWQVYEQVLKFCSAVMKEGGIPKHSKNEAMNATALEALQAAHESFRGIGYHKYKSLFGPEVYEEFEKLNKAFTWFVTRHKEGDWVQTEYDHLEYVTELLAQLPDKFKPYVYFGDYKNRNL